MDNSKIKIKILSNTMLNIAPYRGLRTPAVVEITKSQLMFLEGQGISYQVIEPEKPEPKSKKTAPSQES
jgi:hypothetical protein